MVRLAIPRHAFETVRMCVTSRVALARTSPVALTIRHRRRFSSVAKVDGPELQRCDNARSPPFPLFAGHPLRDRSHVTVTVRKPELKLSWNSSTLHTLDGRMPKATGGRLFLYLSA